MALRLDAKFTLDAADKVTQGLQRLALEGPGELSGSEAIEVLGRITALQAAATRASLAVREAAGLPAPERKHTTTTEGRDTR